MYGLVEIFVFCGVLCYFFNLRPNNMVDVLSTRLQEVYAKWETRTEVIRNAEPPITGFSLDGLRRAGQQLQRRKIQNREYCRREEERSLFRIKENSLTLSKVNFRPTFLRYTCQTCTPFSNLSLAEHVEWKNDEPCANTYGVNILVVKPGTTLLSRVFNYVYQVAGYKRYNYPMVTETVLNHEKLKEAIKLTALDTFNKEGEEEKAFAMTKAKARNILLQMESRCSDFLLKIVSWLMYKLLPCFIQSAVVLSSQMELLKKANDTGLPLVLLPLHRSHLDYIMISFIMVANNIRNPLIAAGDNLKIPFFGWLLRGLGAFYIKRRIDPVAGRKDFLYRTILQTYIMESLRAGHNIEFFVEGGRTRTGKPCMPKSGILSVIVDAYMDGIIEDALLVPIAINYERLVDGNFVREQLGQSKKMETFASTIKAMWSTLMGHYGIVKIDFCQPFSLREMVKSFQAQPNQSALRSPSERPLKYTMSNSSLYGTDVIVEEHRQLVDSIARHVVYDSSKSTPIMSTNVVACLLLNKFRDGCTFDKLVEEFASIRENLLYNREANVSFCGENVNIVKHALDILGPGMVIQQQQEIIETVEGGQSCKSNVIVIRPVTVLPNVIELSYYSNAMLSHYVMKSIIMTALRTELQLQTYKPNEVIKTVVFRSSLFKRVFELCDILRYEFILCKPCEDLETKISMITRTMDYNIIKLNEEVYLDDELWSRRIAQNLQDSSEEEYERQNMVSQMKYTVNLTSKCGFPEMEFLHAMLRPLIDTYTCSASNLKKLIGRSLCEQDLVQEVLSEIKTNLDDGTFSYGESLCVDPIKNSFKLFEKWNIIECNREDNVKMFCLKKDYDNEDATRDVVNIIAAFK